MSLMLIYLTILMSILFLFMKHPLSLGIILLIQTIIIALMTGMMNYSFWFSYIIFLIMVGGMLILFIYMTSIASNEKFKFSYILLMIIILVSMIMLVSILIYDPIFINLNLINNLIKQPFIIDNSLSLNKFINWPSNMIFYMIIIYLFITLIMTVKITNIKSGPLRQKL